MGSKGTALVLGATGGIGGETAAALLRHGWTVVAMVRGSAGDAKRKARAALAGAMWVSGDACTRNARSCSRDPYSRSRWARR